MMKYTITTVLFVALFGVGCACVARGCLPYRLHLLNPKPHKCKCLTRRIGCYTQAVCLTKSSCTDDQVVCQSKTT